MQMIPLKDAVICWTGNFDFNDDEPTKGKCAVFPAFNQRYDAYQSWVGGHCCFGYENLSTQEQGIYVLQLCFRIIIEYKIHPLEVFNNIICKIKELNFLLHDDIAIPHTIGIYNEKRF